MCARAGSIIPPVFCEDEDEDEDAVLSQLSASDVNICLHHVCLSSGVFVKLVFSRFPATHHRACLGPSRFPNGSTMFFSSEAAFAEISTISQIRGDLKNGKADILSVFFGLLFFVFFFPF